MVDQKRTHEQRRLMLTQLLHAPVLNPEGDEVGKIEDVVVKMGGDGAHPPVTGFKVRSAAQDVFISESHIADLNPRGVKLDTYTVGSDPFARRPGEVLLAADVLGRHVVDMTHARIVQAHDLVLTPSDTGWQLAGIDRSPQAMLRRLIPRRGRPDLRRHSTLDWKEVQPFVRHVPTARLLMPLQRLRRLHPAQIADIVEGASHEEGEEIIHTVESDAELTADVFEELNDEHQVEFVSSRSDDEVAKLLDRMQPDDAADLISNLDQDRRKPVFDLLSASQQHKVRKLLSFHPNTAGGMMHPDFISVHKGSTVAAALEAVRVDRTALHQLKGIVFVTDSEGKFVGSVTVGDLLRAEPSAKLEDVELVGCSVHGNSDAADATLTLADYNLSALAVIDDAGNLIGAVTSDDIIEALIPEEWRARIAAATGV